jgi:hypothetical protein
VRRAGLALLAVWIGAAPAAADEWLLATEGNRLHLLDLASHRAEGRAAGQAQVWIPSAADAGDGRDVNGMICALPDGSGRFVLGEDTGQPEVVPGWGVFSHAGEEVGKLTATYRVKPGEPYGCAFDAEGRLFTTAVGNKAFGLGLGQLLLWFPPFTGDGSGAFCKLRVYVAASSGLTIWRFSPPFPTSADAAGGCGATDELGSPRADRVQREPFFRGLYTFSGLAFGPNGHLFAASVFTGEIVEISPQGELVRKILEPDGWIPPFATGNPMGIAFDAEGSLYYADLDLQWDLPSIGPGPDGKVRRIRFAADGTPQAPETLMQGLAFPDGVAVFDLTFR